MKSPCDSVPVAITTAQPTVTSSSAAFTNCWPGSWIGRPGISSWSLPKAMIDPEHELSVTRQARALNISRSSVYYLPRPVSPGDLALMRRIDELHLDYPFAGSRMLRDLLGREGFAVGRLHVSTLMKRMGIEAIYPKRRTTWSGPGPGWPSGRRSRS